MRRLEQAFVLAAGVVLLGGCAGNDLMVKRMTEAETKIDHLFQAAGTLQAGLNEQSGRLVAQEERNAAQATRIQALEEQLKQLAAAQQTVAGQLAAARLGTPKVELVNPDPPGKGKELGPPASYLKAFGLYSANNFAAAIPAFEQFVVEYPASDYVPNALYWIGECYYTTSDIAKALTAFQRVLDGWPRHPKAADALLKIGYSQLAQKQPAKARDSFERLIRSYPGSPAAVKARERIMSLESPA